MKRILVLISFIIVFTNSLYARTFLETLTKRTPNFKEDLVLFLDKYWDICEEATTIRAKTGSFDTRSINIMSKLVKTGNKELAEKSLNSCSSILRYKDNNEKMQYPNTISTTKRSFNIIDVDYKVDVIYSQLTITYDLIPDNTNSKKSKSHNIPISYDTNQDGKTFFFLDSEYLR